jgi:hypothetical protein
LSQGVREGNIQPGVLAFWHKIQESKNGVRISWEELKEFAGTLIQTDLTVLLALGPGGRPPIEPVDLNSEQFEIVVQASDFDLWAVTTPNQTLIARPQER